MALLASLFREKVSKEKDVRKKQEADQDVAYSTGFLSFDFMNGQVIHVRDQKGNKYTYNSIGVIDGSMVMVIGRSGSGKTTLIMQSASAIVKPFETACIYHDDIEGGITRARKEQLTEMYGEEFDSRYIPRNTGITAENFYERIKTIHDIKVLDEREKFEYDTGCVTTDGKPIYKLEPTVYILDSLALLMPEKYTEEDELSGQMAATAAAKANTSIFKRIVPMLKSANIILYVVNHITQAVSINMFDRTPAAVSYLKQGETLPGGRAPVYLSNLLIRLDDGSKLKEKDAFGINASVVEVTILKSRTAPVNSSISLIFDYKNGFDKELSLFYLLKERGYIGGAGAYLYIGDRNDVKFSQRAFKEKLAESEVLQQIFAEYTIKALMELINDPGEPEYSDEKKSFDISAFIMNQIKVPAIA
ncbi:MAG: hypothetical protein PHC62_00070 [Candidatus Izemoplasmatales bacterium]|nr:hypothetical protein [Candidatus Izemoplasmatales bacterium]